MRSRILPVLLMVGLAWVGWLDAPAPGQEIGRGGPPVPSPRAAELVATRLPTLSGTVLEPQFLPIDLPTALRVAGVQDPDLMVARQQVVEAVAQRQFAAVQIIPTLNGGPSFDSHTGPLQQSNGNILTVNRSSYYIGSGSYPVAAGTVSIPGLVLTGNVGQGTFQYLVARQEVRQREFLTIAERNQVLLRTCLAYCELIRAEAQRAVAQQVRNDAAEVARITAEYARTGQGREADARRASTYLARRQAAIREAEEGILTASARLARAMNVDPSIRFHPTDPVLVPMPIVPEPMPVPELIALALIRRPELAARRVAIEQALLSLEGARLLPFSPTILIGFSAGGFGGGSNLVRPVSGGFGGRTDFDSFAYWSLLNMGAGNVALIRIARAQLQVSRFQELAVLDRVRDEVAEAHAKIHARFAKIGDDEQAVRSGIEGFRLDLERIRQAVPEEGKKAARPVEVVDSLRLLQEALTDYIDAIVDYNRAHFELYVAVGQPPAAALAHPVPTGGIAGTDAMAAPPPLQPAAGGPEGIPAGPTPPLPPPAASPFAPNPAPDRSAAIPSGIGFRMEGPSGG